MYILNVSLGIMKTPGHSKFIKSFWLKFQERMNILAICKCLTITFFPIGTTASHTVLIYAWIGITKLYLGYLIANPTHSLLYFTHSQFVLSSLSTSNSTRHSPKLSTPNANTVKWARMYFVESLSWVYYVCICVFESVLAGILCV